MSGEGFDVLNALLIADRSFATRERELLKRVQVGLADEGIRPLVAEPGTEGPHDHTGDVFLDWLEYEPPAPLASVGSRAARLISMIEDIHGDDSLPDVVHVWGEDAISIGAHIAHLLPTPIVVEVWAKRIIPRLKSLERRFVHQRGAGPLLWAAPSEAMLELINRAGAVSPSRFLPWGVHTRPQKQRNKELRPTFALVASGTDPHAIASCVEGFEAADTEHEFLMLLDSSAVREHRIVWGAAQRADLLDRISIISEMESRRDLVLDADILLQPESKGEIRSVTLDALANGMVVVALRDEVSDALTCDSTIVLDKGSASEWRESIQVALRQTRTLQDAGASGREFIRTKRSAARHINSMIDAYASLLNRAEAHQV